MIRKLPKCSCGDEDCDWYFDHVNRPKRDVILDEIESKQSLIESIPNYKDLDYWELLRTFKGVRHVHRNIAFGRTYGRGRM